MFRFKVFRYGLRESTPGKSVAAVPPRLWCVRQSDGPAVCSHSPFSFAGHFIENKLAQARHCSPVVIKRAVVFQFEFLFDQNRKLRPIKRVKTTVGEVRFRTKKALQFGAQLDKIIQQPE